MNILHVIASPSPGGIESYVKDLAIESVANDQFVHVCFLETASEAATSQEFEKEYLTKLESAGVKFFFIGRDARLRFWRGIAKMRKYVQENSIDIFHSHLTYGIVFGACVGIPRVYTHHSVDMRVGRFAFALLSSLIDQLVGISDNCAKVLSAHAAREVVTIVNGVDLGRFPQEDSNIREIEDRIDCISVGRVCAEKNYELLVQAVARLPVELRCRLSVKIVGAGSEAMMARLEKAILDGGLCEVVHLLGSRSDIPALLASSQLFIMSSSTEGLPIALIEAAVSGLPCIVTDAGSCREVIEECRNGIVVEPDNPQALADAIEILISDPTQIAAYSANALNCSKGYSIENSVISHTSMYTRLLSSSHTEVTNACD